jgi:TonB family protein
MLLLFMMTALATEPALAAEAEAKQEVAATPIELLYAPKPTYPVTALEEGVSGSVLMLLDVNVSGQVVNATVIEADRPDMAEAAIINARAFRFSPPTNVDGTPIELQVQYRTVFEVQTAASIRLEGRVREAGPRTNLVNATIRAKNSAGEEVYGQTDAKGRFQIAALTPGEWNIQVSAAGHVDEIFTITTTEDRVKTLNAYLVRDEVRMGSEADEEIVVSAISASSEVTERTLSSDEVRYLPGTGGDVVKVVQNLPGIARAPLGTGSLRIRGTAPEDSLYFLDGGSIPIVFHFAGLNTILSSDLLSEVGFFPGSYSVRYGRALGGLVDLRTLRELPDRSNGYVSVDIFQATAFVEQLVGKRDAITVSGRRSYADAVLNPILNKGSITVQAPRYYDAQVRWSRKLDNGWNDIMFLMSDDRFRFLGQGDDEVVLVGYVTQFQKLRWLHNRSFGDGIELDASAVLGPENKFFESQKNSEAYERDLRIATRVELKKTAKPDEVLGWVVGMDPNFTRSTYLYDIARPPERTVSTDRAAPTEEGASNIWSPSLYGEVSVRWGDLTLAPGLRGDAQLLDDIAVASIDPRLRARWMLGTNTALKAGAGRHSQAPTERQLLPSSAGNPELTAEQAYQYSAGIEQQIINGLRIDLTGFYHDLDNLVSGRENQFSFYSGPPPAGPFDTDPYANDGTGRTFGVESMLNIDFKNTTGFVSATVSRSDRIKRPDAERTLFPYDQPVVINGLVSQKLPKRWRVGTRVRYGSGNPYTPVVNRIYNHDRREFIPVYGERDSARLPPFFSLDVRIDKDYVFKKWTLTTYLDIQNATYSKNVEQLGYSYDYTVEEPLLSNPPLPAFGLRGEW